MYVLAGLISLGEIAMIIYLLVLWSKGVPSEQAEVINLIYGMCLAYHSAFMVVIGYFFGSSKSSAEKTEMLGKKKFESVG